MAPGVITAPSRESGILDSSKGGENSNPERKHLPLQKLETQAIAAKERSLVITTGSVCVYVYQLTKAWGGRRIFRGGTVTVVFVSVEHRTV